MKWNEIKELAKKQNGLTREQIKEISETKEVYFIEEVFVNDGPVVDYKKKEVDFDGEMFIIID